MDNTSLSNNSIYSIYKDPQANMWVGTYSGGVNLYSRKANQFTAFRHSSSVNSPGDNNILGFVEDRRGNIWIGTDGGGVDLFDPASRRSVTTRISLGTRTASAATLFPR
ncbi:two-component regulator propeller domain-containing protein [Puia sp. P3]|uniref:two-component regulator propeller domain-containing protein n=1 Tax=Puia sp. P3 TaxID=3423952 RepID=UPI003D667F09